MTRQTAPVSPPVVLTIAGSDSGGGAGIQADLKTIEAGGAFGTSAITSVTAQHTRGVENTHPVPVPEIEAQIDAVLGDFDVAAVKTGMLGTREVVEAVRSYAPDLPNLVVDPVMVASSGDRLLDREAEDAYEDLLAEAALVTPNADEAEVLTGVEVTDVDAAREAGERLLDVGVDAALVKGGHVPGDDVVDVLVTDEATHTYRHDRIADAATHGSGCTLSSAVATRLAHGDDLAGAVGDGVSLLSSAVRYHLDVGEGPGAVHHLVDARDEAAREETVRAVAAVVETLLDADVGTHLPPGGGNVAGTTPYAEAAGDVAGVDGGLVATLEGATAAGGVRFGAGGDLADVLLAARERDPTLRFATTIRYDEGVAAALADLDRPLVEADERGWEGAGEDESADARGPNDSDGDRSPRRIRDRVGAAVAETEATPAGVVGATGGADRVTLLATSGDDLAALAETALGGAE